MSEYDWIEKLEKQPNYKLGQNFLIDTNISRKITKLVQGQLADPIIEVGPGTGSLTNELLKDNYRIKAVEIDSGASELLKLRFQDVPNLEIFNEDAMSFDYSQLTGPWWIFVSNLPYNIGTRLLVKLIVEVPVIHRYVVMVQKEVAQRIVADQESDYGALSVLFGLFTESKIQFDVSKNCFYPPPKITSSVITIQRESLVDQEIRLNAFEISKVAFQQRRKKVRTSLSSIINEEQLKDLDIDINSRAGNLSPDDYLKIAKARQ
jgi:16S rRNA (adenine1518-N6/adenine1519-N6)-dimethyltransferase